CIFLVFFFQAEDGIRDRNVTGVQTCALPISNTLQFHEFPAHIQEQMFSSDKTTLLFNVSLEDGIESSEAHDTLEKINDKVSVMGFDDLQFEITGPAGITADTIILFK